MTRSPDSLIPFGAGQPASEKRDDKAFNCRQEGEANLRAATEVNVVSASLTPPVITPIQLDLFPGRACSPEAKPATVRSTARRNPSCRDGVEDGGTQRQTIQLTGETLFGPAEETPTGREAYKGRTRKRGNEAGQGVGGGRSTDEPRDNRGEGRAATFIRRTKQGKAAGLPPQGKAQPRTRQARRKAPARLDNARKLQRTLYRVAKQQPERRFTLLYDKVCRQDILQEAWQRVKSNKGAAGVDQVDINAIRDYGEDRFLNELEQELRSRRYRTALVRRVHIPKPGQPGKTRPLGIPTVKDRVVQMAVKLVIEPLFEADFMPCSFGFRPKRTPRMALSTIVQSVNDGYSFVVDVDLKSYFDTISHELLLELVERRVGDVQVLRLIRAWLKAGVMEEGKVTRRPVNDDGAQLQFSQRPLHQFLELAAAGLNEPLTGGGFLDAIGLGKAARHQRVVPCGQPPQHLPPDFVLQSAGLLEQFVGAQSNFAAILAAQSAALDGHFLSIYHHKAVFPAPAQRLAIRPVFVAGSRHCVRLLLDRQQDHAQSRFPHQLARTLLGQCQNLDHRQHELHRWVLLFSPLPHSLHRAAGSNLVWFLH